MKIKKLNISAIKGFKIGNATDKAKGTGCTVIICEKGATGGVDVRGGGPATTETDMLRSENSVSEVHAVVLSGGSAFGLESASGVMRALADKGIGYKQWDINMPVVCGASLFDMGTGDRKAFPDVKMGEQAVRNAYGGVFKTGNEGAGTGATVGKFHGMERAMKTGLGSYACGDDCIQVGAVVAVNAMGDVYSGAGNIIAGLRSKDGGSIYGTIRALKGAVHEFSDSSDPSAAGIMSFTPPKEERKVSDKDRKAMLAEAMEQEFKRTTQFRKEEVEKLFAEIEKEEKKKKEAEKKKKQEADKKKLEAEKKKKAEEEKKKKLEEARKKAEEKKKIEEEKLKFEAEQKRLAEEKKRIEEEERRKREEEKKRFEEVQRKKREEEKKRLEAEKQKKLEEEKKKAEKETEDFYLSMEENLRAHAEAEEPEKKEETAEKPAPEKKAESEKKAVPEQKAVAVASEKPESEAEKSVVKEAVKEPFKEEPAEKPPVKEPEKEKKAEEPAAKESVKEKKAVKPAAKEPEKEKKAEKPAAKEPAKKAEKPTVKEPAKKVEKPAAKVLIKDDAKKESAAEAEKAAIKEAVKQLIKDEIIKKEEPVLTPVKENLEPEKPVHSDDPVLEIEDPVKVQDTYAAENTALEIEQLFADADVSIDEPPTEADEDKMGYDIPFNTTIGCLITNAKLTKAQANKLASILHDAYARAIKPVHSTMDGDTIFVLSSGQQEVNFDAFAALATDVMQYAIIDGATSAKGAYGLPSANDMK